MQLQKCTGHSYSLLLLLWPKTHTIYMGWGKVSRQAKLGLACRRQKKKGNKTHWHTTRPRWLERQIIGSRNPDLWWSLLTEFAMEKRLTEAFGKEICEKQKVQKLSLKVRKEKKKRKKYISPSFCRTVCKWCLSSAYFNSMMKCQMIHDAEMLFSGIYVLQLCTVLLWK